MTNKLTIEDILKNKKIVEKKKNEPYFCKMFEKEIDIEELPVSKIAEILNNAQNEEAMRADYELIYESCPIFRSKELQEDYEIKDPIMIVEKVFNKNLIEINNLAKFILSRYGYGEEINNIKKQ